VTTAAPADYGTAELVAGATRVVIAPSLGGKIVSMVLRGREWLWREPKPPRGLAPDVHSGGLDEFFPTGAACNLPAIAGRYSALHLPNAYSGLALPEHGELWSQPVAFSLETRDEGVYAVCGWVSDRMPYRFVRALYASAEGKVVMRYGVTNDGLDRMPCVWSTHPAFPLTKRTRIELPDGARLRVARQQEIELGGAGAEARWPRVASAGKLRDLSHPWPLARRFGFRLFVDAPQGRAAIVEEDARLEITWDTSFATGAALTVDRKAPPPGAKRKRRLTLSLGPAAGAPDSLADAIGPWKSAMWIEPGETREWTVCDEGK